MGVYHSDSFVASLSPVKESSVVNVSGLINNGEALKMFARY